MNEMLLFFNSSTFSIVPSTEYLSLALTKIEIRQVKEQKIEFLPCFFLVYEPEFRS